MTDESRKKLNDDLLERMRKGESLSSFSTQGSFFPPRPIIKKDEKRLLELYGDTPPKEEKPREKRKLQLVDG